MWNWSGFYLKSHPSIAAAYAKSSVANSAANPDDSRTVFPIAPQNFPQTFFLYKIKRRGEEKSIIADFQGETTKVILQRAYYS